MGAQFSAVVSSTPKELRGHRARVVTALRESGLRVLGPQKQGEASSDRIWEADVFVLLVAFRLSPLVEEEYRMARDAGANRFVFLLDEEAPWWRRYDELDSDPRVRAFREELRDAEHPVSYFGLDPESVEIEPAAQEWMDARRGANVGDRAKSIIEELDASVSIHEIEETLRRVEPEALELVDEAPEMVPVMLAAYRFALDWDGLIGFAEKIDPSMIEDPTVARDLATAYFRRRDPGDLDRSISLLTKAVELSPSDARLVEMTGVAFARRWRVDRNPEDRDSAIAAHRESFEMMPEEPRAAVAALILMADRGDHPEEIKPLARRGLEALEARGPSSTWDYWDTGQALVFDVALESWDSAEHWATELRTDADHEWQLDATWDSVEPFLKGAPRASARRLRSLLTGNR